MPEHELDPKAEAAGPGRSRRERGMLRYFLEYQWFVDFALYATVVYGFTEGYYCLADPQKETNLGVLWCLLTVIFSVKIFFTVMRHYFRSEEGGERSVCLAFGGERSVCLAFSFFFLLLAMVALVVREDYLEFGLEPGLRSGAPHHGQRRLPAVPAFPEGAPAEHGAEQLAGSRLGAGSCSCSRSPTRPRRLQERLPQASPPGELRDTRAARIREEFPLLPRTRRRGASFRACKGGKGAVPSGAAPSRSRGRPRPDTRMRSRRGSLERRHRLGVCSRGRTRYTQEHK
ncbi:PREDICTED: transmembrane protein 161A [Tinamus guttatus]|uniref:transmembrane protein 161A n=1 Tax=Tinamus guttatus TaxID=94827 RepID=UPI00052E73C5|nr:PREDICTED: transmembrane protein 161A [Tinamus guttatus]